MSLAPRTEWRWSGSSASSLDTNEDLEAPAPCWVSEIVETYPKWRKDLPREGSKVIPKHHLLLGREEVCLLHWYIPLTKQSRESKEGYTKHKLFQQKARLEQQVMVSAASHTLFGEDLIREKPLAGCWLPTTKEISLIQNLLLPKSLNLIWSIWCRHWQTPATMHEFWCISETEMMNLVSVADSKHQQHACFPSHISPWWLLPCFQCPDLKLQACSIKCLYPLICNSTVLLCNWKQDSKLLHVHLVMPLNRKLSTSAYLQVWQQQECHNMLRRASKPLGTRWLFAPPVRFSPLLWNEILSSLHQLN